MRIPALAFAAVAVTGTAASAASPSPKPAPPPKRINVKDLQPRQLFPKTKLHNEFVVEVNKFGQVTRVRSVKPSHNPPFDAQTYGNALQAFIRTADGRVVLGTYRLSYDYDPQTLRVHRDVALVRAGGVDPNAKGAAIEMMEIARRNANKKTHASAVTPAPNPAPTVNIRRMPDLPQVMQSPPH